MYGLKKGLVGRASVQNVFAWFENGDGGGLLLLAPVSFRSQSRCS